MKRPNEWRSAQNVKQLGMGQALRGRWTHIIVVIVRHDRKSFAYSAGEFESNIKVIIETNGRKGREDAPETLSEQADASRSPSPAHNV